MKGIAVYCIRWHYNPRGNAWSEISSMEIDKYMLINDSIHWWRSTIAFWLSSNSESYVHLTIVKQRLKGDGVHDDDDDADGHQKRQQTLQTCATAVSPPENLFIIPTTMASVHISCTQIHRYATQRTNETSAQKKKRMLNYWKRWARGY